MSVTTQANHSAAILARTIRPNETTMTADAARAILQFRLCADDERRVNELCAKARDGTLAAEERSELDEYEQVAGLLEVLQSKARLALREARTA
jgi:hypothetical protein